MFFKPKPESYVLPTERRVVRVRPHWASLMKVLGQTILYVAILSGLMWVLSGIGDSIWVIQTGLWLTSCLVVVRFIYHVLFWWEDTIMVTDKRFIWVRGVIIDKVNMMPTSKVTDMTYRRSLMGRVLGYGTIRIESAGQNQALEFLPYMPEPLKLYEAISKLVFGEGKEPSHMLPKPKTGRFRGRKAIANEVTEEMPSTNDLSDDWPQK